MNRIYQGKVTQVEIPDPAEKGKWLLFHHDPVGTRQVSGRNETPLLTQKAASNINARN